jgi:hypothetical protein
MIRMEVDFHDVVISLDARTPFVHYILVPHISVVLSCSAQTTKVGRIKFGKIC